MKICGIICEYNPFHFGHLYQLEEAKRLSGCDAVVCVMSWSFVQRGEAAVCGRYERARHAVLSGADAVLELPAVFSTSSAELFARGAVKLLASLPGFSCLCFGAESGTPEQFAETARALDEEPECVSEEIGRRLREGESFVRARASAWKGKIPDVINAPNNILGVEYARALSSLRPDVSLLPVERTGSGYSEETLRGRYSSATAIRAALGRGEREAVKKALPDCVQKSLEKFRPCGEERLEAMEKYALLRASEEELRAVADCTEGLENALKKGAEANADLPSSLSSRRYTSSRIRRILVQNLLGISEKFVRECLSSPLFLRLLAVIEDGKDLLKALGNAAYPLIVRTADGRRLSGMAKECHEKDEFAARLLSVVRGLPPEKKRVRTEN